MKNISPHVNIYKFPITAISSIATRITGLGLTGIYVGSGIVCFFDKKDYFKNQYEKLSYTNKKFINYSIIGPSVYHSLGGFRHIIWDKYPEIFLKNNSVKKSSFLIFSLTVPFTYFFEKLI